MQKDNKYLKPFRLADVIRLVTVLSVHDYSYYNEQDIHDTLRASPNSSNSWIDLSSEHPEVFRISGDKLSVSLLIRHIQYPKPKDGEHRPKLTLEATQKLIDQIISLHDKQIARYQRNSFWVPFLGALLAGIISLLINFYNSSNEIKALNLKIEVMNKKIDSIKYFKVK